MLRQQLLDSGRGRIVNLLRGGGHTAEDIATKLHVTPSAIRSQLAGMERDGLIKRVGRRAGITRPAHVFELTPEVEQLLSRAYIPLLSHLVRVFSDGLPPAQLEKMLRQAGRTLAAELLRGRRPSGDLTSRVTMVSEILNEELGAVTHVERNGGYIVRGVGCPLAALTGKHPGVCLSMESLIAEVVRAPVHECCDRDERPQCCFEIRGRGSASARSGSGAR